MASLSFSDLIMPGLAGVGFLSASRTAAADSRAARQLLQRQIDLSRQLLGQNTAIRQRVLNASGQLGDALSAAQQNLGPLDINSAGLLDNPDFQGRAGERLRALNLDTHDAIDRGGSQILSALIRKGTDSSTGAIDAAREFTDLSADRLQKNRVDAVDQTLAEMLKAQGGERAQREFSLDEIATVLGAPAKLDAGLLQSDSGFLGGVTSAGSSLANIATGSTNRASSSAQSFGATIDDLIKRRFGSINNAG